MDGILESDSIGTMGLVLFGLDNPSQDAIVANEGLGSVQPKMVDGKCELCVGLDNPSQDAIVANEGWMVGIPEPKNVS